MVSLEGKQVLVTGGLGFIGSHTSVVLVEAGAKVTIVDDLSNSFLMVLERMKLILKDKFSNVQFKQMNICDAEALTALMQETKFDAVIHFAALKAVSESIEMPVEYYKNNIGSAISLVESMRATGCKVLLFSSSCTVYGVPERVPIDEECRTQAVSPYGRTKLFVEELLHDVSNSDDSWKFLILRYFNPVAAHPSGFIGEHPIGVPNNLMPYVQQVAAGQRPELKVFGDDYGTRDGTAIRDYIHVMDLAEAHIAALRRLIDESKPPIAWKPINVGTGNGYTVLEMVAAMESACGHKIPYSIAPRRTGDTEAVWAAPELAEKELGWKAKYNVKDMCRDQWNWACKFPKGYE